MNIEIFLRKENDQSDVPLIARFGDTEVTDIVRQREQIIKIDDIEHTHDTQLSLTRNEQNLYSTNRNHHSNKIFVDKVIIDDFWEINENFYPPTTVFDDQFKKHLSRVGTDDWINNSVTNNTHLFFNGSLIWDIKYPVRRSFFKDAHR